MNLSLFGRMLLPWLLCVSAPAVADGGGDIAGSAQGADGAAEMARVAARLDPASATILRENQKRWEIHAQELRDRVAAMQRKGEVTAKEQADLLLSLRDHRLRFLQSLSPTTGPGVHGGWTDGIREALLYVQEAAGEPQASDHREARARLFVTEKDLDGQRRSCRVDGATRIGPDGVTIIPDASSGPPVRILRRGIALVIEMDVPIAAKAGDGDGSPYCQPGARMTGQYFRIEGAEEIMPWLME